jgi:hypothetical protein
MMSHEGCEPKSAMRLCLEWKGVINAILSNKKADAYERSKLIPNCKYFSQADF